MLMSILVLGYGAAARDFVARFKSSELYKTSDLDPDKARIHVVHVADNEDPRYAKYITKHDFADGNIMTILKDGTEHGDNQTPFGDDLEWLLASDGHDTVVELEDGNTTWLKQVLPSLARKGCGIYLTNKDLSDELGESLVAASKEGSEDTGKPGFVEVKSANDLDELITTLENIIKDRKKIAYLNRDYPNWDKKEEVFDLSSLSEIEMSREGEACGTEDSVSWEKL